MNKIKIVTMILHQHSQFPRVLCWLAVVILAKPLWVSAEAVVSAAETMPIRFAASGKFKMLYDARQRPQAICVAGKVFVVFNGKATPTRNEKGSAFPMLAIYDLESRTFARPVKLADVSSSDHHDSPIIWADRANHLHVLYGCHKSPGVHLVSEHPVTRTSEKLLWQQGSQIAPKMSYPCVFRMRGNSDLIYYRTDGHTSSWTYRVTKDNGLTWIGPAVDVTDLDSKGRLDWSSYQTKIPGKDRRYLHVGYTDYDDNKHDFDPQRFFNPKYNALVTNEWKYNLSYLRIDPETGTVCNSNQVPLLTPVDIASSKKHCEIWDTQWRGAGVPPAVALDEQGAPVFLHVLSEDSITEHAYFYVRKVAGSWLKTRITSSTHQWNSGHLVCDKQGVLHAFVVVGDKYLSGGYMDRHGGGQIEEWTSSDQGHTWNRKRMFSPSGDQYEGWKFNNVQPVLNADGGVLHGMWVFYGWKDASMPDASAFLVDETSKGDY